MKKLIAKIPILYQGRMYGEGETLPAYDSKMVDAWVRAGSAELTDTAKPKDPPADDQNAAQDGQNNPDAQDGQNNPDAQDNQSGEPDGEDGAEDTAKLMEGYLDSAQLSEMKKPDLEALAKQMGVEVPRGATRALIIERLSAAAGKASANDGGAQE